MNNSPFKAFFDPFSSFVMCGWNPDILLFRMEAAIALIGANPFNNISLFM